MAFKPGRKQEGDVDLDKLRTILNQTKTQTQNNPLYQFLNSLLNALTAAFAFLVARIKALEDATSSSSSSSTSGLDYVVLSDGALPTPNPVNDGFGNFIYIPYEP